MEKENIGRYNIMQPLVLSAFLAVGMMMGYKMNDRPENSLVSMHDVPKDSMMLTGRVEELIRFIDNKYVEKIKSEELIDEAVHAVFSKLDPHSIYLSPNEVQDANDQMDGAYNGIGIENYFIDDTVNISGILDDSPAKKAGLQVFDKILLIDGDTVAGKSLNYADVRAKLRKNAGQFVEMSILRNSKILKLNIQVSEVPIKTVTSELIPDIKTAIIKIERFGTNTYKEFMEEVEKHFKDNKAKHIILDLRDNPGGYLPEATNILCQIFEEKDRLLLYTEGRNSKRNEYKSNGKRFFNIDKVIVLIDENSASASEIIAGAIQDWDRGIIVGRRSYGKGLVQEQYSLNNGGAVRLTVARYYTPSGRSIQRDYSDRQNYEDDLLYRYDNGDLFDKECTIVQNGGKYYTQVLKREVSGSGGVTPDAFVALPEIYKNEKAFAIKSFIPEFVFRYLAAGKFEKPLTYEAFKAMKLPEALFSDFNSFLMTKEDDLGALNSLPKLEGFEDDIRQQVINLVFEKEKTKSKDKFKDYFIGTAMEIITKDKKPSNFK